MAIEDHPVSVFPTRVGVDRKSLTFCTISGSFPHTRGGGPLKTGGVLLAMSFSPHAWGWTFMSTVIGMNSEVFPTRVGVDPGAR